MYGYPRETTLAEKIHAMIVLETANSRMKDFYDVWLLLEQFEFDGEIVQSALGKTFKNRNTAFPQRESIIFSDAFCESKAIQWNAFTRKLKIENKADMKTVLDVIKSFLLPLVNASQQDAVFEKRWNKGWK